ncbi:MAG: polysaccharide pyruvyl transferase family protein [Cyanobacteria bacterium J06634_6]
MDADSKEDKDNANIIFYDAETQFENLGDLLINRILLRKLRNFGSLCINLAAVPSWYQEKIEALPSESLDEGNGKFENRVFWIGMRSLFNPNLNVYLVQIPGHYSGGVRGRALKKILYFLLLKLVGVRICRLGTSIGAFSKDRARLEKWQSRFMHYYSVRDSLSQQYAQEIGIRKPRFFPDLAWLVTPCSMEALSSIEKREYVILSFREVNFGSETSLDYQNCFWATLDNVIDQVANELSMKIVVSYQVKRDYTFSKKIFDRYADTYNIHFMESKIDDDSMNSIYSASYMTFSNRLHVLMMSMAYGSLPVGVINPDEHSKILGIFHDSKLEHLILNMYESEQVAQRMNDILASTHTLRQSIVELYSSNQKISKRLLAEVFDEAEVAA